MPSYQCFPLDSKGTAANVLNGTAVQGALVGVHGLSFTPTGGAIEPSLAHWDKEYGIIW